ncbi:MAG: hypothetical protein KF725_14530 [Cyclobacteriaceae bacterium]|nr:hypothetical protein [Cyclobacteriaceae bacterium]UYN87426.1 MAG: hypothetical protein KIT51_03925 [Cyclobacteriaceae bacterium]
MKIPSLFTRIPKHKRFNFAPRHYDPLDEERREREQRIQRELRQKDDAEILADDYRSRIAGSFRAARNKQTKNFDPSANILRLVIITILVIWVMAYLHYGTASIYFLALIIPFYIWVRFFRKP